MSPGTVRVRYLLLACLVSSLLPGALHAGVRPRPAHIVITLDGRDYVTWVTPVEYSPATRLLIAFDSTLSDCRRPAGEALPAGPFQLQYTPNSDKVDAISMQVEFLPARIVLATASGDVVCDGQMPGHVTGVGRVFLDEFEPELPPPQ